MKSAKLKAIIASAFLFVIFAVGAIGVIVPLVGWRPLKNFEIAQAVYYRGPKQQYVFSEEETALIADQVNHLVVHFKKQKGEGLMDGDYAVLHLTDTNGRTIVFDVESSWIEGSEGVAQMEEAWVTINHEQYECDDSEKIAVIENLMVEIWHKYYAPVLNNP